EGSRSGVNWTRRNRASVAAAIALAISVLAVPGTPSRRTCPPTSWASSRPSSTWAWPTMARLRVAWRAARRSAARVTRGIVAAARRGTRSPAPFDVVDAAGEGEQLPVVRVARGQLPRPPQHVAHLGRALGAVPGD